MKRAILIVLDTVGIGNAPDAAAYGDEGSNTVGHILLGCARGEGDREGLRSGPLMMPNLARLGFYNALALSSGVVAPDCPEHPEGAFGSAIETSNGKDTPSGHLEIAGLPVDFDWTMFPQQVPCFEPGLLDEMIGKGELPGTLANHHASGTEVIHRYGVEHIETGKPIFYTSADSVLQIAAHEEHFGLQRLHDLCVLCREILDERGMKVGRVIARPFVGEDPDTFQRTSNRHDYATPPHGQTIMDHVVAAGGRSLAVGKISDVFDGQGVSQKYTAPDNDAMFDAMLEAVGDAADGDLVFVNFVDFDSLYGHRRDLPGYAACLEHFDRRLPELVETLQAGDLVMITADHGNDPTWTGTDHTREQVPIVAFGPGLKAADLGVRPTFSDMGQTIADYLGTAPLGSGTSFKDQLI